MHKYAELERYKMEKPNRVEITYVLQHIPETVEIGTVVAVCNIVGPDADKLKLAICYQYAIVEYSTEPGKIEVTASPFRVVENTLVTTQKFNYAEYGLESFSYNANMIALRANGNIEYSVTAGFGITDELNYHSGTSGVDQLRGDRGVDKIVGGDGDDLLSGLQGDDILYGGKGRDALWGGSGKDTFLFKNLLESSVKAPDTIRDWEAIDTIDVSAMDANSKVSGYQDFTWIATKAFSGNAGELRYENKNGDTYVYADVNGDRNTDFAIHLEGTHRLFKADFDV